MTTIRRYEPTDRERWDAYVMANPGSHFGQRTAWLELTEACYGVPGVHWLALADGRVTGVLPLFRKGGRQPQLFSAPGGLLADDDATGMSLLEPIRRMVRDEKLAWAELRDQKRAWPEMPTNNEHLTMTLALATATQGQWKAFDAKLRNQIRKGEKAGYSVHHGHSELAAFHRVMLENMRDLGTPLRGLHYYSSVLAGLGNDADLIVLHAGREPAATMLTVRHSHTLMDPWASTLRRHRKQCANMWMYWEAIQGAIRDGLSSFDFGRSQWDSPTFRFKQQWGAVAVPLHYQYILGTAREVPTLENQKGSLDLAVKLWQRLPLPLARVLGEPAKRLFPEVM